MSRYYLYRHVRLDKEEPFYIGIGAKREYRNYSSWEAEYSRAFSRVGRNSIWHRITAKSDYIIEIMLESDSVSIIKEKEIEFIALYKRISDGGTLCNLTKGGDGTHGFSRTPACNALIASKITGFGNPKSKVCYQYSSSGLLVSTYPSFNQASKSLRVPKQNILFAKSNFQRAGGYYWSECPLAPEDIVARSVELDHIKSQYIK